MKRLFIHKLTPYVMALAPAILLMLLYNSFYSWYLINDEYLGLLAGLVLFIGGFIGGAVTIGYMYRLALSRRYILMLVAALPCMFITTVYLYAFLLFIPLV